ncbi:hypothetical protein MKX03_013794 [Papaver bracteatum]|nr:hypothetical protein MKX03_013794 [Papaver bracteatum]
MSLPQLKSLFLSLADIAFIDEEQTNVFFSIYMKLFGFGNIKLHMSLPKLGQFRFDSSNDETNAKVELNAPSLSSFIFDGYLLSTNFTLTNISSLVTVDINIHVKGEDEVIGTLEICGEKKEIYAQRTMGILRGIHNVKVLTLNQDFLKVKINPENIGDYWDPELSLPCMICHLKFIEVKGLRGCVNELKFLEILLKHATVLEKVILASYSTKKDSETKQRMKKFFKMLLMFPRASENLSSAKFEQGDFLLQVYR